MRKRQCDTLQSVRPSVVVRTRRSPTGVAVESMGRPGHGVAGEGSGRELSHALALATSNNANAAPPTSVVGLVLPGSRMDREASIDRATSRASSGGDRRAVLDPEPVDVVLTPPSDSSRPSRCPSSGASAVVDLRMHQPSIIRFRGTCSVPV